MTSWPQADFAAVIRSRGSGTSGLPQSEWAPVGKYPVIGQGAEYVEGWTDREDLLVTPNPALVLYGGHTRRAKYVDRPFVPGPNVKILEPAPKLDAAFLFRYLEQLNIGSRGYADHFPEVRRRCVPIPPLREQQRITEILDKADALRAKRRAALAQLDVLNQSIFLDMFGDAAIPAKTIGHLLDCGALLLHKDGNHGSLYPRTEAFADEGIPFLSAKAVSDDGLIDNGLVEHLREESANRLKIGWIQKGDVLLAHNASVGKVALYDGRFERALIGTSLTALRPNPDTLDPNYLAAALRAQTFQRQLEKNMGQTTRNQVPITAQRDLKVGLPSIGLQREFARKIAVTEAIRATHRVSVVKMDSLFESLQQRAFRGRLLS